ncbi:MAG TPA: BREX system ATP-binding domain-containing protein, partial [Fusibacter sp.]|nr:BREX system ATP-binding domain-containing protein [Fusibacter sp.]
RRSRTRFPSNVPLSQRLNLNSETMTSQQSILKLKPLDAESLMALTHKIVRLYGQNTRRPLTVDPHILFSNVMKEMPHKTMVTRHYITKLIEHLDLLPVPEHEDSATNDEW